MRIKEGCPDSKGRRRSCIASPCFPSHSLIQALLGLGGGAGGAGGGQGRTAADSINLSWDPGGQAFNRLPGDFNMYWVGNH